jgi:Ca2+-binding EF-hand superfamily protein
MIRRFLLGLTVLLLVPWLAAADDSRRPRVPVGDRDNHQDMVFLRGHRPVLIRLRVRVDGKPYHSAWNEYLDALFKYLDRDGDGVLNADEIARAPKAQALLQQLQANRGFQFPQPTGTLTFAEVGVDPDSGEVTPEAFANYYRKAGFGPLVLTMGQGEAGTANALTEALFKYLDTDKDGKLSKEELQRAEASLRRLDLDDDDMISTEELRPPANPFFRNGPALQPFGPAGPDAPFVLVQPRDSGETLAAQLLKHYDRDKNQKLSRAESGLETNVFNELDTNGDGELDAAELRNYHTISPDIVLMVRLGKRAGGVSAEVASAAGQRGTLAGAVGKPSTGGLTIPIGSVQLGIQPTDETAPSLARNLRQFLVNQLRAADTKKQGFVERKDLQQRPQNQFLLNVFTLADGDGDGKLTENELVAYLDLQDRLPTSVIVLTIGEQGRGLFEALDANRDGRLSIRELRTAWDRLACYDVGKTGAITREMIPSQFQLTISRGQPLPTGQRLVKVARDDAAGPPARSAARGPLWFQKMDRNGDGDVSLREWLGSLEDFKRIDTDGDGLISLDEAQKADAWFRAQLESQRP